MFLSTVLHEGATLPLTGYLAVIPEGIATAIEHATLPGLVLDGDGIVASLRELSQPCQFRQLFLLA